jgi:hypothetical protein
MEQPSSTFYKNQFAIGPNGERIGTDHPDVQKYLQMFPGTNPDVAFAAVGNKMFQSAASKPTTPGTSPISGQPYGAGDQNLPGPGATSPSSSSSSSLPTGGGPTPTAPATPQSPADIFYSKATELLKTAQNVGGMKDLYDARNALMKSANQSVINMTPDDLRRFPPEVQDAMRKVQTVGIGDQIEAINVAIRDRQEQLKLKRDAYKESLALAKEFELSGSKTRDDARNLIKDYDSRYPGWAASLSENEYNYITDTGKLTESARAKLGDSLAVMKLAQNQSQFDQKQALSVAKFEEAKLEFAQRLAKKGVSGGLTAYYAPQTLVENGVPTQVIINPKNPNNPTLIKDLRTGVVSEVGSGPTKAQPTALLKNPPKSNPFSSLGGFQVDLNK